MRSYSGIFHFEKYSASRKPSRTYRGYSLSIFIAHTTLKMKTLDFVDRTGTPTLMNRYERASHKHQTDFAKFWWMKRRGCCMGKPRPELHIVVRLKGLRPHQPSY